jgi:crossover junction endodeoxyribonuclease RuvC
LPPSTAEPTRVLGIDPGTLATGYGILLCTGRDTTLIACGVITNAGGTPLPLRLRTIHEGLREVIRTHRPQECAVESAFYGRNAQSALKLGQARGAALLAAVEEDLPVAEYAPREVKKAVVGVGGASKEQVRSMVRSLLRLPGTRMGFDTSDAIAVALCHLHRRTGRVRARGDWSAFVSAHPERVRR